MLSQNTRSSALLRKRRPKGTGSISQLPDGRYLGRVTIGGETISVTTETLEAAEWRMALTIQIAHLYKTIAALEDRNQELMDEITRLKGRPKRQPLSRSRRTAIHFRDKGFCRYCGKGLPEWERTVDHVIPIIQDGTDDPENLVTACWPCNHKKQRRTPEQAGMTVLPIPADRYVMTAAEVLEMNRRIDEHEASQAAAFAAALIEDS